MARLGFSLHEEGEVLLTLVMEIAPERINEALGLLGAVRGGLGMALHRIHQESDRAHAARRLARRVSDELRSPVGALTNAIAGLRSEAERAGMAADWVDRVSSESERVLRAVKNVEQEMRVDLRDRRPSGPL